MNGYRTYQEGKCTRGSFTGLMQKGPEYHRAFVALILMGSLEDTRGKCLTSLAPVTVGTGFDLPMVPSFAVEITRELLIEVPAICAECLEYIGIFHDDSPPLSLLRYLKITDEESRSSCSTFTLPPRQVPGSTT